MSRARRHWHEELQRLEGDVLAVAGLAGAALTRSAQALESGDLALADAIITQDDQIDDAYLDIDRRALELLALQTPVAVDLRLISAIVHINLHLERVGDAGVSVAKIVKATHGMPRNTTIVTNLVEMADVTSRMVAAAMESFARRDLDLALTLPRMDDPVDRLNRRMYGEVAACGGDHQLLEWALRMMSASRHLERAGDHAVDIAEQVAFLLTGEFRELSDASHAVSITDDGR